MDIGKWKLEIGSWNMELEMDFGMKPFGHHTIIIDQAFLLFLLVFSDDYGTRSVVLFFEPCAHKAFVTLSIVDDNISEKNESFHITLERTSDLDSRNILNPRHGEVVIQDDDGTLN